MPTNPAHSLASLLTPMWVAWIVYWAIAAASAKVTVRTESRGSRVLHVVPLLIAVWLLAARHVPIRQLNESVLPYGLGLVATGVALTAAGLAFAVWARVHLADNWSGMVTVKQAHALVRDGPYRFVRHPIYTGLLVALIGSALVRNEWRAVLAVAIAFAALWRKLQVEEQFMTEVFGDEYRRYRQEVPALIPFTR
jgi:protein-S-isoprenylcysteine O-methyltransferase Ste14